MKPTHLIICTFMLFFTIACEKAENNPDKNKTTVSLPTGHFYADIWDVELLLGTDTFRLKDEEQVIVMIHANAMQPLGPSLDGGNLTLNGILLEKSIDEDSNMYINDDFEDYNIIGGTDWKMTGNGVVPAISFSDVGFPSYTGAIPKEIVISNGTQFKFDGSTVSGADSVSIYIGTEFDSSMLYLVKTFSANSGTVTLSPADMGSVPVGNGNVIEIVPFTYQEKVFGGNAYAFKKSKKIYRSLVVK